MPAMRLGGQTRTACERCRKKRAKCDGKPTCQKCEESGHLCEYDLHTRRETKSDLRESTQRLRKSSVETEEVLKTIASIEDPNICKAVLQGLVDGNTSRQDILEGNFKLEDVDINIKQDSHTPQLDSDLPLFKNPEAPLASQQCFGQLLSWRLCRPPPPPTDAYIAAKTPPTVLSLPLIPLDAHSPPLQPHVDTWTRTGWTRAHIRHLVDALLTWDFLPFCLFSKDLFLQDYHTESTQFCSAGLVHAVLALATRLINEADDDDAGLLPSGWLGSNLFFDAAAAMVLDTGPVHSLPDIQAVGVLALYHIRCGREAEAQKLTEIFVSRITVLCQRDAPFAGNGEDEQYARSRATTYCGAITLARMLSMATGQLFNNPHDATHSELLCLDQTFQSSEDHKSERSAVKAYNTQLLQAITTKIYQLTEWVYNIIVSAQSDTGTGTDTAPRAMVSVYTQCLGWYEEFFALLQSNGSRTPLLLFVHMYYHFCLFCAFRPFISLYSLPDSDIRPQEICTQAAQSILALAQSYDDLFTLRRVSGAMPYFVCASGLFNLALEDSGNSSVDSLDRHRRHQSSQQSSVRGDDEDSPMTNYSYGTKSEPPEQQFRDMSVSSEATNTTSQSPLKTSAARHAQLLLAKMGSTHPAARIASRVLRDMIGMKREKGEELN
ncbi:nitrate assimilation regulatory protein nirA [Podospora didyma]|uniref:Nitrate assimilation regulatory protein nirA n=1 Tax=Podospora didyma TaxID=330526 RepID=A0AAE0NY85_9PEZI|nr:nitrate assimilation regulatory protein nirA [Podospora didyma]